MTKKNNPVVSIIVPTYNARLYIKKTIESFLNQSFQDFECLIINDGSTDNTIQIVKKFTDPRVKVHTIKNSGGPSKPRNKGIEKAQGKYIFIFDADDLMEPSKLQIYIDVFESNSDVDFIFSDFSCINEQGEITNKSFLSEYQDFRKLLVKSSNQQYSLTRKYLTNELVKANFIGTSSVAFKADKLHHNIIFNESLKSGDDMLAWINLSAIMNFYFIDKPLHSYRLTTTNISNTNIERLLKNKIKVLGMVIGQNMPDKKLIKDCLDKRSEYNFSLGYYYSTNKDFTSSLDYFKRSYNDNHNFSVITSMMKTYISQVLHINKQDS